MTKLGEAYQYAVADVARALDSTARIEVGEWVVGPDGERELDVGVWPLSGNNRFVFIECKDLKRPVGIGHIDALESKRRDLNADVALICSNSGFTADAVRKAARVGIPALCALIEGDNRIRVQIQEEIYTRKIHVTRCESTYHFNVPEVDKNLIGQMSANEITHGCRPVAAWVRDKCIALVGMSIRSSDMIAKYKFSRPLQFHLRDVILPVLGCDLKISYTVQWCSQVVRIGASVGMYDYLRHRVIFGKGTHQYMLKDVDFDKWKPIDFIPEPILLNPPKKGEMQCCLASVSGIDLVGDKPAPDINLFIQSEELEGVSPTLWGSKIHQSKISPSALPKKSNVDVYSRLAKMLKGEPVVRHM
jgi:hypothetical protein